jgi:hypothetical protein
MRCLRHHVLVEEITMPPEFGQPAAVPNWEKTGSAMTRF